MSAMYNLAEDFLVILEDNGIPKADMLKYLAGDGTDDTVNIEAPKPKKYEYRTVKVSIGGSRANYDANELLAEGWECQGGIGVSVLNNNTNTTYMFQAMIREIKDGT